ncbi:MAG: flagellar biosynthetic protein FliO [Candidatus Eremiobacteraeota bacterium]|nr:flagellar biosynthetic protein FliO [Candidatus Eremiobacteraeota bacterium]
MSGSFWVNYILALVVVALMLGGLYALVRGLARGRVLASANRRLVTVLESTALAQHTAVHVVKVGNQYYLLGAGNGHVTTLGELTPDDVESWLSEQRSLIDVQRASLVDAFKFLRGKR